MKNGATCVIALGPSLPSTVGAWTMPVLVTLLASTVHAVEAYLQSATAKTLKTIAKYHRH